MKRSAEQEPMNFGEVVSLAVDYIPTIPSELKRWVKQEKLRRSHRTVERTAAQLRTTHSTSSPASSERSKTKSVRKISYNYDHDELRDVFTVLERDKRYDVGKPRISTVIIDNGRVTEVSLGIMPGTHAEPEWQNLDPEQEATLIHKIAHELRNPDVIADLSIDQPQKHIRIQEVNKAS